MSMLPFASSTDGQEINEQLLREYAFFLANKAEGTIEAYVRTVRQIMIWIAGRPGNGGRLGYDKDSYKNGPFDWRKRSPSVCHAPS